MSTTERMVNYGYALSANFYYRKFVKDTLSAGAVNREVLKEILQNNAITTYGKLYHFNDICNFGDYKRMVPLTGYSDYEPYIEEIAAGLENVLTADKVEYLGLSSGTTGTQKRIPATAKSRKIVMLGMMLLQKGALSHALPTARSGGRGLLLMNMLQSGNTPAGIPAGSGTSGGVQSMKKMLHYFWTSPPEILAIDDQQTAGYLHLLFALQERNLAFLSSPFPSAIVQLFGVLGRQWPELVKDLADGRISSHLALDREQKASLERRLKANPLRAEELKRELSEGMRGIAQRVWPRMSHISCVVGGSFNIYLDKLSYYIGSLPVFSSSYGATEALIGIATRMNDVSYVITPRSAFFEFIPVEECFDPHPATYELDRLKVGELYEVVITNYSGLYRYRMGDVIKVLGYSHQSPVIEFMYRRGQLLNVAAEKTSEQAVQQALALSINDVGAKLEDYTVTINLEGTAGHYLFYIELDEPEVNPFMAARMRNILEQRLEDANPRYLAGIRASQINPLDIRFVRAGGFLTLKQELLKRGGSVNQVKIPRFIQDPSLVRLLEQYSI